MEQAKRLTLYDLRPDGVELVQRTPNATFYDDKRKIKWWRAADVKTRNYAFTVAEKDGSGVVLLDYTIREAEAITVNIPPDVSGYAHVGEWPLPIDRNKLADAEEQGYRLDLNHMGSVALLPPAPESFDQKMEKLIVRFEKIAARLEKALAGASKRK